MRYTPAFLIVLGCFLIAVALFHIEIATRTRAEDQRRERSVATLEQLLSDADVKNFYGMAQGSDRHQALKTHFGTNAPTGNLLIGFSFCVLVPALASLSWGIAEMVGRHRKAYLAANPVIEGKCSTCGYDMAGVARGAPCPECAGKRA